MLEVLSEKLKDALGEDAYAGLIGMFFLLHFYYGVPDHGWIKTSLGAAAVLVSVFLLSVISCKLGNGFRSVLAFTAAAVALDFFYQARVGQPTASLVFNYLANGPAIVNFASFGCASAWLFSQLESVGKRRLKPLPMSRVS